MPVTPAGWTLKVGGLVKRPMVLTLDQLRAMARTQMRVQHHCVEGWSAVASWHGVRLSEIARLIGIDRRVKFVEFRSFDSGYWSSWDLASALHPQTLLCYEMNGKPLSDEHGAPLRLIIPVKYGIKHIKRIGTITYSNQRPPDFWAGEYTVAKIGPYPAVGYPTANEKR